MTLTVTQWILIVISLSTTIASWTAVVILVRNRRDYGKTWTEEELD